MIIGIDEVGRGCLAGPVCVGAVLHHDGLAGISGDSKLLSADVRVAYAAAMRRLTPVSLGWASAAYIDSHGLTAALRLAAQRALATIDENITQILLDGNHNYIGDKRVKTIIHGDAEHPAIGAASIIAKVARDAYMHAMHARYPTYGFITHVGYATPFHRAAIQKFGASAIHRLSFAPLKTAQHVN